MYEQPVRSDELYHFGVKGMRWGIRRYQNEDGTLTDAGRKHYTRITKNKYSANSLKQVGAYAAGAAAVQMAFPVIFKLYGKESLSSISKNEWISAGKRAATAALIIAGTQSIAYARKQNAKRKLEGTK